MSATPENPFELQKASQYSSEQILDHWVDIAKPQGGLLSVLRPTSLNPMFLLGGKGSGKTHLMRYCSAPVQAARHGTLAKAIAKEKYAGVYVLAEGLNTHKFSGKGLDREVWSTAFSTYFEIWLATSLLSVVKEAIGPQFDESHGEQFADRLSRFIDVDERFETLADLQDYLVTLRRRIDYIVNNSAITRDVSELTVPFSTGSLIFGIPDLVAEHFTDLGDPLFVYLIDELENFTADQQKFLNTIIRYRRGRSTIKVGARLYGVRTYETLGSGEPIKDGAEFEKVLLDDFLRNHETEYRQFAIELALTRLHQTGLALAVTDEAALAAAFDTVDKSDNWRRETLALVRSADHAGRLRPHLEALDAKLNKAGLDPTEAARTVKALSYAPHPLLEKCGVFCFIRRWSPEKQDPVALAEAIAAERAEFENDRKAAPRFGQVLSHFSSDLLAQMYKDARQPQPYAGLDELVELSQGVPRNFLGILAHIYRRAQFAGEAPFAGGKISVRSQSEGVMQGARSFRDEAQPDADAADVRDAVEALALLFRSIRFSDAPSECDVCTFSINPDQLSERSKTVLRTAENWSHLVQITHGARNKNTLAIDQKFQFSPMLAPLWGISQHRRGHIELKADLANAIFDADHRTTLLKLLQERTAKMNAPRAWGRVSDQGKLI